MTVKAPALDDLWRRACHQWERTGGTTWSFGSIPKQIECGGAGGASLVAFPALVVEEGEVWLRLCRRQSEAQLKTPEGWSRLIELALSRELAWMQKDLRSLERHSLFHATLGSSEELVESAFVHLKRKLFPPPGALDQASFDAAVAAAREAIRGVVPPLVDLVGDILRKRQDLLVFKKPYAGMREDLNRLVPKNFLSHTPPAKLAHVPRFLRALQIRAERATLNSLKDAERVRLVQPFVDALLALRTVPPERLEAVERFRWLLEEFKVSVFAQELGTSEPVSAKRLQAALAEAQGLAH